MTEETAIKHIMAEVARARKKHPNWPADPIHQAAIVAEEAGETVQAALDCVYAGEPSGLVNIEATQCAATCVRLLVGR